MSSPVPGSLRAAPAVVSVLFPEFIQVTIKTVDLVFFISHSMGFLVFLGKNMFHFLYIFRDDAY
jgi:hypothetical protein